MAYEFGIDTFGDVTLGADGRSLPQAQVIRNVVAEGILADQVGLDFIGLGEHHRDDFAISAPELVLAGIATRTERIRLGSAVTVLSSDDPVRVFQRFATLDALSSGRAEVILGRGSFTESFPIFGYDLADYDALFAEKLDLFVRLLDQEPVHWQGRHTQNLAGATIYPPLEHGRLRTWVGVGGSPESVVRTARYGLGLMLAIIGGPLDRFAPYAELYRRSVAEFGNPELPIGVHSPGHIAETDEQAREEYFAGYRAMAARIGRERGWAPPTEQSFLAEVEHGALMVGSPETVARKLAAGMKALGAERFDVKVSSGTLAHEAILRSIELYGTRVVPLVRDLLS